MAKNVNPIKRILAAKPRIIIAQAITDKNLYFRELLIQHFLQRTAGVFYQVHDIAVLLAGGAQYTDVAAVTKRAAEPADNQAHAGAAADGIFSPDVHAQRLVGCRFA